MLGDDAALAATAGSAAVATSSSRADPRWPPWRGLSGILLRGTWAILLGDSADWDGKANDRQAAVMVYSLLVLLLTAHMSVAEPIVVLPRPSRAVPVVRLTMW